MMDCTDRHDRFFLRLMSKNVMLYTEMVATKSAIHGDRKKILSFSPEEKPLALQVGGSNKEELAEVAKIAEDMGYDEINIFFNSYINSLLFYVMMISMLLHSKLGLQTIVDDYVTSKKISKNIKRALNINAYMLMILITIFIVRNIL